MKGIRVVNRRLKMGIAAKISIVYFCILIIVMPILSLTIALVMRVNLYNLEYTRVQEAFAEIEATLSADIQKLEQRAEGFKLTGINIAVTSGDRLLFSTFGDPGASKEFDKGVAYKLSGGLMYAVADSEPGGTVYSVYITADVSGTRSVVLTLDIILAVTIILGSAVAVLLGRALVSEIVRPITQFTETTARINRDNINTRLDPMNSRDELRDLAIKLNEMLDGLSASFAAQDRFVSDVSHELRTPLAVLDGYSQLLTRWGAKDPAIMEESIKAIADEAKYMKVMIDNMLFLSRTERNTQLLETEDFFLDDLLDEVIVDAKRISSQSFVFGIMKPTTIRGDRELIRQLIRIIVENAVKYSQQKSEITVSCFSDDEDIATIIVADRGIGISEDDIPHLFERFFRSDKARTRDKGGTGLGLSIAKKIADSHGADIIISSEASVGTTVKILFPDKPGL